MTDMTFLPVRVLDHALKLKIDGGGADNAASDVVYEADDDHLSPPEFEKLYEEVKPRVEKTNSIAKILLGQGVDRGIPLEAAFQVYNHGPIREALNEADQNMDRVLDEHEQRAAIRRLEAEETVDLPDFTDEDWKKPHAALAWVSVRLSSWFVVKDSGNVSDVLRNMKTFGEQYRNYEIPDKSRNTHSE